MAQFVRDHGLRGHVTVDLHGITRLNSCGVRHWLDFLGSLGEVGVISDFAGENYDFSGEILNLSSRRDLLVRVLWNLGRGVPDLAGLKAAVWADSAQPAPQVERAPQPQRPEFSRAPRRVAPAGPDPLQGQGREKEKKDKDEKKNEKGEKK